MYDQMKMKSKVIDDLMQALEGMDDDKLKPKAAVSITAMKPGMGEEEEMNEDVGMGMGDGQKMAMGEDCDMDSDELSDDDLKMLIKNALK